MCGICGFIGKDFAERALIEKMNGVITHRGPDSDGYYVKDNLALAMRRLSVIDLSTGDQPMYTSDRKKVIVYNGEVYNFKSLRKDLESKGYLFNTASDTETIIHGYDAYGVGIFNKLNGMFGIAIFDCEKDELILARDRIGVKPLFYFFDQETFIFGSEIKSILQHPKYTRAVNYETFDKIIKYKYSQGEDSAFAGIKKLKPGHYIKIAGVKITEYKPFWQMRDHYLNDCYGSYQEACEHLKEAMDSSVKRMMISDVPLGVFLSGGVDSTIVTSIMAQISSVPVKSFTIGFDEKSYSELKYAKLAAEWIGTDHHEQIIRPANLMNLIDDLVGYMDEPTGDGSIIPTYFVSKYARENVTVSLSGIGADELFAGYERYWISKFDRFLGKNTANFLVGFLSMFPDNQQKKSVRGRLIKFLSEYSKPHAERYQGIVSLLGDAQRKGLYTEQMRGRISLADDASFINFFEEFDCADFIDKAMYTDLNTILPDDYLVKDDRMSMANSLEVRVPFLDNEVVDCALRIRNSYKLKGFRTKHILRDVYKDSFPPELLKRGKYGFESPFALWAKNELKDSINEVFSESMLVSERIMNKDSLTKIILDHQSGAVNHGKLIFTLLTSELWFRRYF